MVYQYLDKRMIAWLESYRMECAAQYAQAGRRLRNLTDEEVNAEWSEAMHLWAETPFNRPALLDEVDSELALRGLKPPALSKVQDAWATIRAGIETRAKELENDPKEMERLSRSILYDMDRLFERDKNSDD